MSDALPRLFRLLRPLRPDVAIPELMLMLMEEMELGAGGGGGGGGGAAENIAWDDSGLMEFIELKNGKLLAEREAGASPLAAAAQLLYV